MVWARKKFVRRTLPRLSNLFWEVPRKQNDAVPQGAGKAPKRDPEKRTGYEPVDTHMNQKIPEASRDAKPG
ncbi:MAG: hypothetical protein BGO25_15500 [Acidobacteriales bacterium 59-55]|nr:MAG: hypothetical protein BGO25_15500 [Acidobacteriales bacterium 59-55]